MGRRGGNYTKVTTHGRDIFGRKVTETRYIPEGSGCGTIVVLIVLWVIFTRGC